MDIVLEVVDTFVGDRIWASVLPAPHLQAGPGSNVTAPLTSWEYKPTSPRFYFEPSQYAYESAWARDFVLRQAVSLFFITWVFGLFNYFFFSTLSYLFIFDHDTLGHPKFLKNQIWLEIKQASLAMPGLSICTTMTFLLEVRGYAKLYDVTEEGPGLWYDYTQIFFFIMFTDFCIYWAHRWLHAPLVYKYLHKRHHKWIMPSPYASYAFHPLDGFVQSAPYHLYPLLFPMHKFVFVGAFIFVNFWTIAIHDGEYITDNPVINGSACHTAHHLFFNYNYGQFTTLWDRLGGSYRKPDMAWFNKQTKKSKETLAAGIKEMEQIQKEVEGDTDDRTYIDLGKKKN
ncbi:unnamed protein product [Clonostachys byssicola]|uniref:Fatty acid hydroxylase domain-containing protein n=1 Tax=Clonostachys byssicola TaxID=160290 RepID=A0A9N9XUP4_9HYPO|nr:unnamed protein product [Clonostachys byssicola]